MLSDCYQFIIKQTVFICHYSNYRHSVRKLNTTFKINVKYKKVLLYLINITNILNYFMYNSKKLDLNQLSVLITSSQNTYIQFQYS